MSVLIPEIVGTVTIRNGGHIVIPEDALVQMGLADGDDLVVYVGGMKQRIILTKPGGLEESFEYAIQQLQAMKKQYEESQAN